MKAKIPEGWRELKAGEHIKGSDRVWSWNEGPWQECGLSSWRLNAQYRPHGRFPAPNDWTIIRRITKTTPDSAKKEASP